MTNRRTLKFSIFAAGVLALALPVAASAQWGGYPRDRYPDDRGYGRYDDRGLRDSVHRLDSLAKDFERDMDRALDHSRANGSRREDQINAEVHQFRNSSSEPFGFLCIVAARRDTASPLSHEESEGCDTDEAQ